MAPDEIGVALQIVDSCRRSCRDGKSSMPGLKMPLSGMVEKTTIIHSGNSQISASGVSDRVQRDAAPQFGGGFRLDLISAPSRARD